MKDIAIPSIELLEKLEIPKVIAFGAVGTDLYYKLVDGDIFLSGSEPYLMTKHGRAYYDDIHSLYGVRPIISLSKIPETRIILNGEIGDEIGTIEYGEYPQSEITEELISRGLESFYRENRLKKTNKEYTILNYTYQEYEYDKDRYVYINNGYSCDAWFKVEPIKWYVFKKEGIALSQDILLAELFSYRNEHNYEKSNIKYFLEDDFIEEIKPPTTTRIEDLKKLLTKICKEKKLTTEDIDNLEKQVAMIYKKEEKPKVKKLK